MTGTQYDATIDQAAQSWGVDPNLLRAVVQQESGGNSGATSAAGASGLTQLLPPTASGLGVTDATDPTQQIYGGAKYLSQALKAEGGNVPAALSYYHGGPAWRQSYGPESAAYAPAVMGIYSKLGATPASNAPSGQQDADPFTQALNQSSSTTKATNAPDDPFSQAVDAAQKASATAAPPEAPATPAPGPTVFRGGPGQVGAQQSLDSAIGRIGSSAGQGFQEGFGTGTPGISPQGQQELEKIGFYNGPGQYSPVAALNKAVLNPAAAVADLAMRTGAGLFRGAQGAIAQAGAEVGAPGIGRGMAALPEAFAGDSAIGGAPEAALAENESAVRAPGAPESLPAPSAPIPAGVPVAARLTAPVRTRMQNDAVPAPAANVNSLLTVPAANTNLPTGVASIEDARAQRAPAVANNPLAAPANTQKTPGGVVLANDNPLASRPTAPIQSEPAPGAPSEAATPPTKIQRADQATAERQQLLAPADSGGDATEYVPGVRLQKADITGSALDATEAKRLAQTPEGIQGFRDLQNDNNNVRLNYFDQLAGNPSDVASLKAARAGQGDIDLQAAFANKNPADAQPVVDTINSILKSPDGVRPLVQRTLGSILDTLHDSQGNLQTDPEMLYGARKAIDDTLSKEAAKTEPLNARVASNLQDVKSSLDQAIEKAAPGFKEYLSNYSSASRPIDQMELLQGFLPKLTNGADRNLSFNKVDGMMRNIVQQRAAKGNNQAKSIDPETMAALFNLHADLKRSAHTEGLAKTKGSDTNQLLSFGKKAAGKIAEGGLALHTHGASIPLVAMGKNKLEAMRIKKDINDHLFPDAVKLAKKASKKPTGENPLQTP